MKLECLMHLHWPGHCTSTLLVARARTLFMSDGKASGIVGREWLKQVPMFLFSRRSSPGEFVGENECGGATVLYLSGWLPALSSIECVGAALLAKALGSGRNCAAFWQVCCLRLAHWRVRQIHVLSFVGMLAFSVTQSTKSAVIVGWQNFLWWCFILFVGWEFLQTGYRSFIKQVGNSVNCLTVPKKQR